ncbi:hypothetical protein CDV31_007501 [Fusarium ambrosium]|uniref:Uncharacterized protein n=1 Tax=Fusarium ambrosium TaxID=131363 RepID=A0A428U630_9HYPO|nr:hypothetical protein CDV31_007501 [Fusarium ambrosium]
MAVRLASPFRGPLRVLYTRMRPVHQCRRFHERKADFVTLDANESLETRKLHVITGDPHEAYVIVDQDVGFAMRSAIVKQTRSSLASDAEKIPLAFHHESRHFAHDLVPYPRIILEHDLPHQSPGNTSPATLWLWGATHSITLDGTTDGEFLTRKQRDDTKLQVAEFEEASRESHKRLEGAAELLKHK